MPACPIEVRPAHVRIACHGRITCWPLIQVNQAPIPLLSPPLARPSTAVAGKPKEKSRGPARTRDWGLGLGLVPAWVGAVVEPCAALGNAQGSEPPCRGRLCNYK